MASTIGRNLHLCFTKIKHPTSSSSEDHNHPLPNTTIEPDKYASTSSILVKNFNSLYEHNNNNSDSTSSLESDTTPDFAAVIASNRFFFSSPGRSNSIIDSSSTTSSFSSPSPAPVPESDTLVGGGIAIPTYSPDPYNDFRRSMQEMVEARELVDVRANWDYLHELLLCYLALNPKSTHKFIVGAFADLLVSLVTASGSGRKSEFDGGGGSDSSGGCL